MTDKPSVEDVRLPIRLGELMLGRMTLRLSVDKTHFLEAPEGTSPPRVTGPHGHLVRSSPAAGSIGRLRLVNGTIRYVPQTYRRHYIDLSQDWTSYQQQFSGKSRQSLRRKVRKFAKASGGELDCRVYRRPEEIRTFLELARQVARVSYQERLLDAALPDDLKFQARALALAERDSVRGYLLFLEGRPVAYLYCPAQEGVLLYRYLGYRPDAAPLSPGTVLQWLALESLFEEDRFRAFDFCEGDGPHKAFFGTHHRVCGDIYWLRPWPKPLSALVLQLSSRTVSGLLARSLDRFGLKGPLKKALRFRSAG